MSGVPDVILMFNLGTLKNTILALLFVGIGLLGLTKPFTSSAQAFIESSVYLIESTDSEVPTDIENTCNAYSDAHPLNITAYLDGEVLSEEDIQLFTADVVIDSGDPISLSFDSYNWNSGGFSTIDFSGSFNCAEFKDGNTHTLTSRVYDQFGAPYTNNFYFFHDPVGVPSITINDESGGELAITSVPFSISGNATVNSDTISAVSMTVNGGDPIDAEASNAPFDTDNEGFSFPNLQYYNGSYSVVVSATASNSNTTTTKSFTLNINAPGNEPGADPVITLLQSSGGVVNSRGNAVLTGSVSIDTDTLSSITYTIEGQIAGAAATIVDGTLDEADEDYSISLNSLNLSEGDYTLTVFAEGSLGGSSQQVYTLTIDNTAPSCGTSWYNQTSPAYTNTFSYANINCTDNEAITMAQYRIYHYLDGNLTDTAGDGYVDIGAPTTGSYGDAAVTLGFNAVVPVSPNHDGALDIELKLIDTAGNTRIYFDPMIVDYEDQTAPTLSLQLVRPDPISDDTPTITGTCTDNEPRETNTNITTVEISVDNGGWQSVTALDGNYNSTSEKFSYTLPTLADGAHEIDVRCSDAAANVTTTSGSEDINFTIEDQELGAEPELTFFPETFDNHTYQDLADTTLIWGNGKLRLKEDLPATRSAIDTTAFRDRYTQDVDQNKFVISPAVDSDYAWYTKDGVIGKLNTSNDTVTAFDAGALGVSLAGEIIDIKEVVFNAKNYLLVSDIDGLSVFNLTDNLGYRDTSNGNVGFLTPDVDRGRFGIYVVQTSPGASEMKAAYWNLATSGNPFSTDTFTNIPEGSASMVGTDVVRIFDSPQSNEYYLSVYDEALYRFNDNNTPTTFGDDTAVKLDDASTIGDDFTSVFGMTFTPAGQAIVGTSGQENGELFVMTSDTAATKIATARQLGYNDVFGIAYLAGANGVGDQLFIETENGNPVYMNFNSTFSDTNDDTFIELVTNGGIRPSVTKFIIGDYNTLYANIDRQGLYKINLNRGWEEAGRAVALPPRPDNALAITNLIAEAVEETPIAALPEAESQMNLAQSRWIPQAYAQEAPTITYEVSTNDGATWETVTLGELQEIAATDYRLQFRITMTPAAGQSPVISEYSLEYGGYPDPDQIGVVDHFEVSVSPNSFAVGSTFTINVTAKDVLGFTVTDYTNTASLALLTPSDENVSSRLNLSQISLTNGVGSATGAVVTQAGTYTVQATQGSYSNESSQFTVTSGSTVTPTLTFTADNYSPRPGQEVTLRWVTTNMNSAELDSRPVDTTGTKKVSVMKDTTFRLNASGAYGALTATVTLTVDPDDSIAPTVQASTTSTVSTSIRSSTSGTGGSVTLAEIEAEASEIATMSVNLPKDGVQKKPTLSVSGDAVILEGEKVIVWWNSQNATSVTVDYLGGGVGNSGQFEFFGKKSQKITITAFNGDEKVTKTVMITVKNLPAVLGEILPDSGERLLAGAVRHSAVSWVAALLFLTLFPFYKRRPKPLETVSWWKKLVRWIGLALWVISPLIVLLNVLALTSLGGWWRFVVSALCLVIMVRHAVSWYKEAHPRK